MKKHFLIYSCSAVALFCTSTQRLLNMELFASTEALAAENLACNFSVDGVEYKGQSGTIPFPSTKELAVQCESRADSFRMIQVLFKDEASARTPGSFKIVLNQEKSAEAKNEASVGYEFDASYASSNESSGSISVTASGKEHVVRLDKTTLKSTAGKMITVSGQIPF